MELSATRLLVQQLTQLHIKKKQQTFATMALSEEKQQWLMDYPRKGQVMRKVFKS